MQKFFIYKNDKQQGPFTLKELKKAGIATDTYVWAEGMTDWKKAGDTEELKELFVIKETVKIVPEEKVTTTPVAEIKEEPVVKKEVPVKQHAAVTNDKKKFIMGIGLGMAGVAVVGALVYFLFLKPKHTDDDKKKDVVKTDTAIASKPATADTAKTPAPAPNIDTTNNIQADTTGGPSIGILPLPVKPEKENENTQQEQGTNKTTENNKKETQKPNNKKKPETAVTPQPEKVMPVNAADRVNVSGGMRRNLLGEAVLEGNISNRNNFTVHTVTIEAMFISANGEVLKRQRFTNSSAISAGGSAGFKWKTAAPLKARGANFRIVSAD